MIKAVVFDLWLTLIPATIDFVHLTSLISKDGMAIPDFNKRYEKATQLKKYKSFDELRKDFFKEFKQIDNQRLEQELYEIYTNRVDKIGFFPDVKENLEKLHAQGYKLGLLSNTESLPAKKMDENLGLSKLFDFLGYSFEINALKPEKEAFLKVLKKLGVKPSEALMVGDSLRLDIAGANAAGMHSCLINRKGKVIDYAQAKPEFEITSLDDIYRVLGVLNAKG